MTFVTRSRPRKAPALATILWWARLVVPLVVVVVVLALVLRGGAPGPGPG